jgi:hypothetical protein
MPHPTPTYNPMPSPIPTHSAFHFDTHTLLRLQVSGGAVASLVSDSTQLGVRTDSLIVGVNSALDGVCLIVL